MVRILCGKTELRDSVGRGHRPFGMRRGAENVLLKLQTPVKFGNAPVFADHGVAAVGITVQFDP